MAMGKDKVFFEFMDYIWKYFEIHANQRIMLFKFYIGFCGLFISAIGYLLTKFHSGNSNETVLLLILLILSVFLIVITHIFRGLDKRNKDLIEYAEDSLKHLEEKIPSNINIISSMDIDINEIKIFTKEKNKANKDGHSFIGHTKYFNRLFIFTYLLGYFVLILCLCKLKVIAWLCHRLM